ncbi:hypothetical protein ACJ41O_010398 [Fusarium nematophilum]
MGSEPSRLPPDSLDLTRRAQIISTTIVDTSLKVACDTLDSQGAIVEGTLVWIANDMDKFMLDHVKQMRLEQGNDLGQFGGWTGAFFNLFAIADTSLKIDCRTTDSNCNVPRKCDGYNDVRYGMGSIAIANIHAILAARIKAYDSVISEYDANDQQKVRSLFVDLKFPETRGFRLGAFLSGFFLGAEIAFGGVTQPFTIAIRKAIKIGLEASDRTRAFIFMQLNRPNSCECTQEVIKSAVPIEVNIAEDGRPVIDALRQVRDSLQAILFSWNMRGVNDPSLQFVSAEETVEFFQEGAFLWPLPPEEELISTYAQEIERQMATLLSMASSWETLTVSVQEAKIKPFTVCLEEAAPPICLQLGQGDDLAANFQGKLADYGLDHGSIAKNAARCHQLGGSGKWPPAETDTFDFGFPRFTFPLEKS